MLSKYLLIVENEFQEVHSARSVKIHLNHSEMRFISFTLPMNFEN